MNLENIPMKDANDLMKIAVTLKFMVEKINKELKESEEMEVKLKDMLMKTMRAMKNMGDEKDAEIKKLKKENAELKTWCNYDDLEVD
tara:strand:- start:899 stop:1159 length:261 start_codon:yes stop_codon:yes gene_type:complete